jgi:hypothetical protein
VGALVGVDARLAAVQRELAELRREVLGVSSRRPDWRGEVLPGTPERTYRFGIRRLMWRRWVLRRLRQRACLPAVPTQPTALIAPPARLTDLQLPSNTARRLRPEIEA